MLIKAKQKELEDAVEKIKKRKEEIILEMDGNPTAEKKESLNKELSQINKDQNILNRQAEDWQQRGILFNSITGALSAGSLGGTIGQAVSPFLAQEIGKYFKKKDAEGTPEHLLAHGILGAAVAAAGGNNPFVGGISAATAEKAAPILAHWIYGKEKKDLTADEQSTISSIVSLIGAGIGGIAGGNNNVIAGGDSARNAVDNNAWVRLDGQIITDYRIKTKDDIEKYYDEKDITFISEGKIQVGSMLIYDERIHDQSDVDRLYPGAEFRENGHGYEITLQDGSKVKIVLMDKAKFTTNGTEEETQDYSKLGDTGKINPIISPNEPYWTVEVPNKDDTAPAHDQHRLQPVPSHQNPSDALTDSKNGSLTTSAVLAKTIGICSLPSGLEHLKSVNWWKGKNGKWYMGMSGKGPNQYTGPRSLAPTTAKFFKVLGVTTFVAGTVVTTYQVATGEVTITKGTMDVSFGAIATFGGPPGFIIGTTYFVVDNTIGWDKVFENGVGSPSNIRVVSTNTCHIN